MANPKENSKDSFKNTTSLQSTSEPVSDLKHQDAVLEDDYQRMHEDGVHIPLKLSNSSDTNIKSENFLHNSFEKDSKVRQEETENDGSVIRKDKESTEVIRECSERSDQNESYALERSQRRKNCTQKVSKGILPNGSRIFCFYDNSINNVKKNIPETDIQLGLTEVISQMELSRSFALSKHKDKPEDISDEFYDHMVDVGAKNFVQDTIVEDDAISHKSEKDYQPVNPYSTNDHNDIHKIENSGFTCVCGRNYPKQMEHGEKEITQSEYMDLSKKPVRINSLEEFCEMEGLDPVDFMNEKESKAKDVGGKSCESRINEIDMPQEKGRLFQGKNQEFSFKMKTHMYSDYVKRPQSWGFYSEKLAILLKMFLGCQSIMNRNTKETLNVCYPDIKSQEISLLKDITSTWYFFPMFTRFMEYMYCLPCSLQNFFERLISGVPISQAERMSYEWLRLDSFNTLPSSFRGTAIRLAQSGFYYTRQGTCIRCYSCNVEHEGWNNTADPHRLHQRISPTCLFLRGNPTYPNYPIIPDTVHSGNTTERSASSATPVTSVIQGRTQSRDLETPQVIIPSIHTLSTPALDEVSIPQVEARGESITTHDSSISQTQQQSNINPITATSQPETIPSSSSMSNHQQPTDAENRQYISHRTFFTIPAEQMEDPGVNPMPQTMSEHPKHPEHGTLSSRISSYTSWPVRLEQTPQQMAEAGFYYAGINDYTRCFHCGGGLRNWEPGDDPWIEHARWHPQCAYVLGKKGQKFVNAVLRKQTELLAAQNAERNVVSTTKNTTVTSGSGTSSKSTTVQQPITQSGNLRYFQNPNENDIATRLIDEMGYQRERVREVILEVRRRRGQQKIAIEHAVELLVADEERKTTAGRQNEAATLHELIQETERLVLHDDCGQQHPLSNTSLPPAPPPTAAAGSFQHDGHQHQDAGGRSSGQQQSGQTNQSTGLGRNASLAQIRQNTSCPLSIAVDVSSSSSFGNQEGHQRNNSTAAGGLSAAAPLLSPTSLPALGNRCNTLLAPTSLRALGQLSRGIIALPPRPRPRRRITPLPPRPLQNESITMDHTQDMALQVQKL